LRSACPPIVAATHTAQHHMCQYDCGGVWACTDWVCTECCWRTCVIIVAAVRVGVRLTAAAGMMRISPCAASLLWASDLHIQCRCSCADSGARCQVKGGARPVTKGAAAAFGSSQYVPAAIRFFRELRTLYRHTLYARRRGNAKLRCQTSPSLAPAAQLCAPGRPLTSRQRRKS